MSWNSQHTKYDNFRIGEWVKVRGFGGHHFDIRVERETRTHVFGCTPVEIRRSFKEERRPRPMELLKEHLIHRPQPSWEALVD